ncbi:MAG: gluconolaconase [Cyanobacteria bacterium SZAS TMP-1]|nr:gluconolaconase [Cyanobacteria bacterium SZAS TMP-1]
MNKIIKSVSRLRLALPLALTLVATASFPCISVVAQDAQAGKKPTANSSATEVANSDHDPALELYADLPGPMLRGLTMSSDGRVFVTFPRIDGVSPYTVAELVGGKPVPYPSAELNKLDATPSSDRLISVMSAVIDNKNRLWLADSGRVLLSPVSGAGKLVGIDLATNKILKTIVLGPSIVSKDSVLHDLRYDTSKGKDGVIYISDSAPAGKSAIIVVDIATGKCLRRLSGHKTVQAEAEFIPFIEGRPMLRTLANGDKGEYPVGVSGLAVKPNANILYYCPQASRQLYSVDTALLCDPSKDEFTVEQSIKDLGPKSGASDGLECDRDGSLLFTDFENSTVWRRTPEGKIEKLVHDTRLVWPDSLWIGTDGYLYITSSQFNQRAAFNKGTDLRSNSYQIFRYKLAGASSK